MTSVSKQGKALKRFLQGKDPRRRTPSMRFRQQATNESSDNANNGLIGSEISKDLLMRLINKEIIEKPSEQEILFLCAVQKARQSKYNIGGLVGSSSAERNRFLILTFEVGSKPRLGGDGSGNEPQIGNELFVVVYYVTVSPGPDYQVSLKNDLYLNDLASVEYGAGTDFTITFDQTVLPFSAATPTARDEIVWNLLTICDVVCQGHPETRSVDLHGLSLTATTQNFLQRNEVLSRYMPAVLDQNSKLARNPKGMKGLMDPSFLNFSGDDEVETMLNSFKWPEQTVDDIDGQLNEHLKRLERETIDVLLSWEETHREAPPTPAPAPTSKLTMPSMPNMPSMPSMPNMPSMPSMPNMPAMPSLGSPFSRSSAPAPTVPANTQSEGYLSTLSLVHMLDDMSGELESMEQWLSRNGDALALMQKDMLEIEQENNRLELQWKNYQRLNAVLKPLLTELTLDADAEKLLRNPAKHLELQPESVGGGVATEKVDLVVQGATKIKKALALLKGGGSSIIDDPAPSPDAVKVNPLSPLKLSAPPPPPKPLAFLPKRLLLMQGIKTQADLINAVRDDFVDKASKQLCSVFGKLVKADSLPGVGDRKESLVGGKDSGRPSTVLTGPTLLNYQRQMHNKFLDFGAVIEVLVALIPDSSSGPVVLDDLLKAYADAGNNTFYKPLLKSYFNQLNYRTSGGSSAHSALSSLPRSIISDITPPPSLDALGTDQLTVSAAIGQGLAHFLPVVKREQTFVVDLFRLSPDDLDEDNQRLESVLLMEFERFRERVSEKAEEAAESDPFEGLAILAVIQQTLAPSQEGIASDNRFVSELLLDLQMGLSTRFNKFIQEQDNYITHLSAESKRAGVLAPFAKFPSFVDRLQQAVRNRPIEIANLALQKLCTSLHAWLEKLALKDPKYADVVRLENYHYFAVTMATRQQRLQNSNALQPYIETAQQSFDSAVQRYLVWMVEYQFPTLTAFFQKLEDLIVKVGSTDVQIHVSRSQLLKMMEHNSRKSVTEGLQSAYRRLRKHISDDSGLFLPLWDRLTALLFQKFSRYEEIAQTCYDVKLEPSPQVIRQLAQECRSIGTGSK